MNHINRNRMNVAVAVHTSVDTEDVFSGEYTPASNSPLDRGEILHEAFKRGVEGDVFTLGAGFFSICHLAPANYVFAMKRGQAIVGRGAGVTILEFPRRWDPGHKTHFDSGLRLAHRCILRGLTIRMVNTTTEQVAGGSPLVMDVPEGEAWMFDAEDVVVSGNDHGFAAVGRGHHNWELRNCRDQTVKGPIIPAHGDESSFAFFGCSGFNPLIEDTNFAIRK